ncbi:MAG TPA: pyridoxamine 5'-phosphate oxidase [Ferruginibacter sp.]|nr:pyridoxamine 5'-phosphate oxidase [Ferruginibacter sp.]HMP19738.1 pyridoxamine 5'-phosphate oxidase [Ferruginibacter sp.]
MKNIAGIRKEYRMQALDEATADINALRQFDKWWDDAISSNIDEVNAFTLATVDHNNRPCARILLLKGYTKKGFIFFTNYESAKGMQLAHNPFAAMVFFWKELERQVRIEGKVHKVSEAESNDYFHSRPEGSRIGAWASPQSTVIESRKIIEENVEKFTAGFAGKTIERPEHWGGYYLVPDMMEFWQGRPSRLHDRLRYTREEDGWNRVRLAP